MNLNHLKHHLLWLQAAADDAASGISFWCRSSSGTYPLTCAAREALPVARLPLV